MSGFWLVLLQLASATWAADPLLPTSNEFKKCYREGAVRYSAHRKSYLESVYQIGEVEHHSEVYALTPDQEPLLVEIYRPVSKPGPLPVILQIHGGGWIVGDRLDMADIAKKLAARGAVVISPDYRLAPWKNGLDRSGHSRGYRFPAQLDDLKTLLRWIGAEAFRLGLRTEDGVRIWGFSAGANLAAMLATTWKPEPGEPKISLAATLSARVDLVADRKTGIDFLPYYLGLASNEDSPLLQAASPAYRLLEQDHPRVPLLAVHEVGDFLIPVSQLCRFKKAARIGQANLRLMLIPTRGRTHGPTGEPREVFIETLKVFFGL